MGFIDTTLANKRPEAVRPLDLPRRETYHPSPSDWRDEVLYFLLPDRFSDGLEDTRPLLDRRNLGAARPASHAGEGWQWDRWMASGGRFQGGTLRGVASKLGYLQDLGITSLWIGPVFKQRGHLDTYHGYAIQDFLDVDPRLGDRRDLVDLVAAAHRRGMRIILDIVFNHSGTNWLYAGNADRLPYKPPPDTYPFGAWRDREGNSTPAIGGDDDGVWPRELQDPACYTRAGAGNLGAGDIDDPIAENKRSDFEDLRDFNLDAASVLDDLARCYKYWLALTDCDGFRIDTLKHVPVEQARRFIGQIREFAAGLGKRDFFLVGEIAGSDAEANHLRYVLMCNLSAALNIGEMKAALRPVAKGLRPPVEYFKGFLPTKTADEKYPLFLAQQHVMILDDHDQVSGEKTRFSADAATDHQVVAGVALLLLALGIPCLYYGTEQALAGPEAAERRWLPGWGSNDTFLREAMFGPDHPRRSGLDGLAPAPDGVDGTLPGFGPFGTSGHHCFDPASPVYTRIAALGALRKRYLALRIGRQYLRDISLFSRPFGAAGTGEIIAWSRIRDDEELLCVVNGHGSEARGADVIVDAGLNPAGTEMTVVLNTAQVVDASYAGTHAMGSRAPVIRGVDGKAWVEIRGVGPSEVVVLANRA